MALGLTKRLIEISLFVCFSWRCGPTLAMTPSFTQRCATVVRAPLDEWSARRRDLYLATHNIQTDIHAPGGFRTHDLSRRAAVDLRLRRRGHWDRPSFNCIHIKKFVLDCKFIYILWITENTMGMPHLKIMDDMKSRPIIRILCNCVYCVTYTKCDLPLKFTVRHLRWIGRER
jgi:hypothetical protein